MIARFLGMGLETFECYMYADNAPRVPTLYAYYFQDSTKLTVPTLASIIAMLFGGIHCAGWNFPFPSHAELIIWRVSSLIILIVPTTGLLASVLKAIDVTACQCIGEVTLIVLFPCFIIYALARLTLFVEAFIALRQLPPGAYAVVEWTALLLHM